MSGVSCPQCEEPVRVPTPIPVATASVQCPWCQETFVMREVLERLPPVLAIIDSGTDSEGIEPSPPFSLSGSDDEPANTDTGFSVESLQVSGKDQPVALQSRGGESNAVPAILKTASLKPVGARKSSAIKSILQVIVGGAASIPLALGILFLLKFFGLANPNLGFAPFDGSNP